MAPRAQAFLGAGPGLVVRSRGRLGLALAALAGARNGNLAGRGEALLSFVLDPLRQRAVAPYAAGGVALVGDRVATNGYLVGTLGVAGNPGRSTGWFVEAGVGGGVRLAAGLTLRRRMR